VLLLAASAAACQAAAGQRLEQHVPVLTEYSGTQLASGEDRGVRFARAAVPASDDSGGECVERAPGRDGSLTYPQREAVDSIHLTLLYPASGTETVFVDQADASLDTETVKRVVFDAQADCSSTDSLVGRLLHACKVSGGDWYNVSWTVPFHHSACSDRVTLELSGARKADCRSSWLLIRAACDSHMGAVSCPVEQVQIASLRLMVNTLIGRQGVAFAPGAALSHQE
jgi:hypothetical protein